MEDHDNRVVCAVNLFRPEVVMEVEMEEKDSHVLSEGVLFQGGL